ncbi:MAG: hypothetical protein PHD80_01900 [Candidatus ainarchaeum sp.]|nr:hypothetical protein [Candidatus ainarchaeum sp.]
MKKIILLVFALVLLFGCTSSNPDANSILDNNLFLDQNKVVLNSLDYQKYSEAKDSTDLNLCNSIVDSWTRYECLKKIGEFNKNQPKSFSESDLNIYNKAVLDRNSSLCSSILDDRLKFSCTNYSKN